MGLLRKHRPATEKGSPTSAIPIADARDRTRICVAGQVVRIRSRPARGLPSMAVTISDDSGMISAVWTGRRAIGGITLGRHILLEGVARRVGSQLELTNPEYTLLASAP
jgi:RecG-like helicase